MIQVEEVVALDERIDRVTLVVRVSELPDDPRVLLVEVIRQATELKGLQEPACQYFCFSLQCGPSWAITALTIQKDSLSPVYVHIHGISRVGARCIYLPSKSHRRCSGT